MTERKVKPSRDQPVRPPKTEGAFDQWLQRGLHQLFDDVASEPVPEELLKIIREDQSK